MLRIMDDAVNGTENRSQGRGNQEENNSCQASNSSHRRSPFSASGSGGPAWRSVVISAAYCDPLRREAPYALRPKKLVKRETASAGRRGAGRLELGGSGSGGLRPGRGYAAMDGLQEEGSRPRLRM